MAAWVLIVVLATGSRYGGYAVTTQEFTSKERCEFVRQRMMDYTREKGSVTCVER